MNTSKKLTDMPQSAGIEKQIRSLVEIAQVQATPGNIDQGEYMRGLANGLALAVSIITGQDFGVLKTVPGGQAEHRESQTFFKIEGEPENLTEMYPGERKVITEPIILKRKPLTEMTGAHFEQVFPGRGFSAWLIGSLIGDFDKPDSWHTAVGMYGNSRSYATALELGYDIEFSIIK